MGLVEIEARIAQKEWDEALDEALKEWRATKAPAYANLVDAISSKISRAAIPTSGGYYFQFQAEWLSRARSRFAIEIPPLLDALGVELVTERRQLEYDRTRAEARVRAALEKENLPFEPSADGPFVALATRLEALASFGPDPRVAKGLVRFLELAPISASGALAVATYGPVFDLIEAIGDVRVLPALEALPPSKARDRVLEALRQLDVPPVEATKSVMSLAAELGFTPAAAAVDVSELLALVVEDIEDDTPRAVLADRWLEANDPRGEFVSLQLRAAAGPLSDAEVERMHTLQAQNESEWLGETSLISRERRFHRGFLDHFALVADATVPRARWETAMRDPRLGTVRSLHRGGASEALYRQFLESAALRNLEEIEVATEKMLEAVLARRPAKVRRVALTTPATDAAHQQVSMLTSGGLGVNIWYRDARSIGLHASLLKLASAKAPIVMRGIDASVTANGGSLEIVSKDAHIVVDVLRACPDLPISLSRPRGAKIWGPSQDTRLLATRIPPSAKLDASWTAMLKAK